MRRALFISDTQIPFESAEALPFLKAVQKEFKIDKEAVFHVGDEIDCYFAGQWEKDPDALHTPNSEISEARKKLKAWYRAFPYMRIAISNHGLRWARRAASAGIPSQILRPYEDFLEAPKTWKWRESWQIKMQAAQVYMFHGMGYSGAGAYRQACINLGTNVVFGHLHANAGIAHVVTGNSERWGMNVGCLVDNRSYAMRYGRDFKFKPWLGCGVVIDGGLTPLLIPYERF